MSPESETDLAEAVRAAKGPLAIRGGGTRRHAPEGCDPLETRGLSGIRLYEPGALTMVAGAGTPLAEIEAMLEAEGQRLAFEPMDHRGLLDTEGVPTIGGVVAGNVSGPRRIQVGACRDFMLGVRFVDGTGAVVKNGGRVMKNVTGYDLVKLMTGSHGTLGVLSEVAFKVLPATEMTGVLLLEGLDDDGAVKALGAALGSPFEVTGAAHLQKGTDGAPVTMIRLEGFEKSVAYRAGKLQELLSAFGDFTVETDPERTTAGWRYIRDVVPFHNREGDVWRFSVKPSDAPVIGARLGAAELIYDWGGGLIWALSERGADLRAAAAPFEGHATLVRAGAETRARLPVFQPEPAPLAAISARLRTRFDPRGILNPGLMG
ncbi:2-hydroxy-acid oxidase [Maritimibacter sp. 55A14]|uniref:FAD-binding protein n=1 Tax=Maritimibacter sp. 55A14 TaxID=2174844 RepID=UPI000D60C779|nr:FAD-binding protein [Maritimibacter sp. 55A14]PWE32354.1 2-hydroxy-acid oxidase [Maritimibacter sp. 55A14]